MYKSSTADVYVVFGEAKSEDQSFAAQQAQAQHLAQQEAQEKMLAESFAASQAGAGAGKEKKEEEPESDGEIDETDVNAKDIELVMQQVSMTYSVALKMACSSPKEAASVGRHVRPGSCALEEMLSRERGRLHERNGRRRGWKGVGARVSLDSPPSSRHQTISNADIWGNRAFRSLAPVARLSRRSRPPTAIVSMLAFARLANDFGLHADL